jgi:antitoxin component YwqK of YwqJK toxin-antitoxin module
MKYAILLLFILPLGVEGQETVNETDSLGRRQGIWQKRFPDGKLMYEGHFIDDKPVGEWKRYQDSGILKAIMHFQAGNDTVKARLYDPSGKPFAEGSYVHERKVGLWIYYSGEKKISEEYFSNGSKNGTCRKYYPSGQLLEESEWKDDQPEGIYRAFYPDGKPYLECMYRSGKRYGLCVSYYRSGTREVEAWYENNLPEHPWKYYDEDGNIRFVLQYRKGVLQNPEVIRKMDTGQLEEMEKQRDRIVDPEKYLQNPGEFLNIKNRTGKNYE